MVNLDFFERIFVINLTRRPDRLVEFIRQFDGIEARIKVFDAVDGAKTGCPEWWMPGRNEKERSGAWGCMRSHSSIWEMAMAGDWENVLIFEDDCELLPGFTENLSAALAVLPKRWDFLYLGGEMVQTEQQKPFPFNDRLLYAYNVNRTHAYALNKSILRDVYDECYKTQHSCRWHVDWFMGEVQKRYNVVSLAVHPWLCGQRGGESDIFSKTKEREMFPVHEIDPVQEFDGFDIASPSVGYGELRVESPIGSEGSVIRATDAKGAVPILAHAPSSLYLHAKRPLEIAAAQNAGCDSRAPNNAFIDANPIGTVHRAGRRTKFAPLSIGVHKLEFHSPVTNACAHTVWLLREPLPPVIEIYSNSFCPRDCAFCNQQTLMKESPLYAYGINDAGALIKTLKKYGRTIRVCFTGGEPAFWPQRKEVMRLFRESGVIAGNWVVTSQCREDTIRDLQADFDHVCVSVRPETESYLTDRPDWLRDVTLWNQTHHVPVPETPVPGPIECCCASQGIVAAIFGQSVYPCVVAKNMNRERRWDFLTPLTLDEYFSGNQTLAIGTYCSGKTCL